MSSTPYGPANPDSQEYLTPEERLRMKRTLMFPEEFPKEYTDWLVDFMGVNGQFDQRQIAGISNFSVYIAPYIATQEAVPVGQTSYGGIGTTGPQLTGLRDGLYIVLYGGTAVIGQEYLYMGLGQNGGAEENEIEIGTSSADVNAGTMTAYPISLSNGGNNSLLCRYKRFGVSANAAYWKKRWMIAIRYGTL